MTNHGYTHKLNDEAMSQNQLRAKLFLFKATLLWCHTRSFVKACAEWIPYGEERIKDLEGALQGKIFSKSPAPSPTPRPYNKPKPASDSTVLTPA